MKLQLGVKLIGDKTLEMTLIYICDEAIKDHWTRDNKIFQDDNGITIWSFSDFVFDNRQIRLPQRNMVLSRLKHRYRFKSEEERYDTLKKFYHTLNKWSLDTKMFPNTNTDIRKRVTINNNNWCVI
jgi:hypothetical protein